MKGKQRKLTAVMLALTMIFSLFAGNFVKYGVAKADGSDEQPTGAQFDGSQSIVVGETTTITVRIFPDVNTKWGLNVEGEGEVVTYTAEWSAEANANLVHITGIAAGTAWIKVSTEQGQGTEVGSFMITVRDIPPEKVYSDEPPHIKVGEKTTVTIRTEPANNTGISLTVLGAGTIVDYACEPKESGVYEVNITGLSEGTAWIIVATKSGEEVGSCSIYVSAASSPSATTKPSASPSASSTPVGTAKPSASPSTSSTPSGTAKPSASPSASSAPAGTAKPSASPSASSTPVGTAKPSASPSASSTPAGTAKPSASPSASSAPAGTANPTDSPSVSGAPQATETAVPDNTSSPVETTAPVNSSEDVQNTNDEGNTQTTTTTIENEDGSTDVEEVKQDADGNVVSTTVTKTSTDSNGNQVVTSRTENADGSSLEITTTTSQDGTVVEKTTETQKNGTVVETDKTVKANGDYSQEKTTTTASGKKTIAKSAKTGSTTTSANYTVSSGNKVTVTTMKTSSAKQTVSIPKTVKANGETYTVTAVAAKAFKGNKKVTKVTISSNIKTIGKSAFQGDSKLKTVVIRADKLTSIGKNAFQGIYGKAVIQIDGTKKQFNALKKKIEKSGVGKKVQFKQI